MKYLQHFDRKEKLALGLIWFIASGLFIHAGSWIYFKYFHQRPSVTWSETTFPVVNKVIHRGDPIIFTIPERCAKDNYKVTTTREIIDGVSYSIQPTTVEFKKGCVTDTRYVPEVTKALMPGKYYLRNVIRVDVRWFLFQRVDLYYTQTEPFTIVN